MKNRLFLNRKFQSLGLALFIFAATAAYAENTMSNSDVALSNAKQLFTDKNYSNALESFVRLKAVDEKNKDLIVLYEALCLKNLNKGSEAISLLKTSDVLKSGTVKNEQALFILAECYSQIGDKDELATTAKTLKENFPESSWNVNMDLLIGKGNRSELELRLERENSVQKEVFAIGKDWRESKDTTRSCALLDKIINDHSDLPVGLRAHLSKANMLSYRMSTTLEAIECFESLLAKIEDTSYSKSRIVQESHARLGILYSRIEQKENSLHFLSRALENDALSNRTQWVALQTAGVAFEILMKEHQKHQISQEPKVSPERWNEVRKLCDDVKYFKEVTTSSLCRADLMYLETFRWEGRHKDTISSATAFIEKYGNDPECELEVDTGRYFLAGSLLDTGDYSKSIELYKDLVEKYKDKETMWKGLDHLERCHYYLFENYKRSKAPRQLMQNEMAQLKKRNPESIWFGYMQF